MPELQLRVEEIDAATAKNYLATTEKNRKVRNGTVSRYSAQMRAKAWPLTGQTIQIDESGALIDGRHRLLAIAKASEDLGDSGFTVRMSVIRGAAASSQDYIDTGLARRAADVLALHGIEYSRQAAAIGRLVLIYDTTGLSTVRSGALAPANATVLEFAEGNEDLQTACHFANSNLMRGIVLEKISGFIYYVTTRIDRDLGLVFCEKMREGTDLGDESPIRKLRNLFIQDKVKKRQKTPMSYLLAYSAKTWNAHIEGKTVKRFQVRGDNWPIFNSPPDSSPTTPESEAAPAVIAV